MTDGEGYEEGKMQRLVDGDTGRLWWECGLVVLPPGVGLDFFTRGAFFSGMQWCSLGSGAVGGSQQR